MKLIRRNGHWVIALAGIVCLAYSAGLMAQKHPATNTAEGVAAAHGTAEAHELSVAFRHAAKETLPGMVSIETRGRVSQVRGHRGGADTEDQLENSPFGEMFKNDPRLKDLLRQQPRQAPQSQGMGSGFVIDASGVILTANHVVADAEMVKVKLPDGREYLATDVKTDPKTDLAIIRIKAEDSLATIRLGNSDSVEIGDWVLAIGSPFGLDATVTAGIISAKGRGPRITEREDFLQTDAAINPGNSGGPLINLHGEVIGINTAISTRSGGYDGVGFAIPINLAKWVVDQLIEKGEVTRAYVGVAIQPVTNDLAKQYHVPVGKGAVVTHVRPGSPAAAAKLQPLDLVLKFNGKDVRGPSDMQGIVERLKAGSSYPMLIMRDGKEMKLEVQVQEMPRDYALTQEALIQEKAQPEKPSADEVDELGMEIESAKPEALKKLGYQSAPAGVLITSVKEGGAAAEAQLQQGMLIEMVGSKHVETPAEFKEALKGVSLEKGVVLLVRTPRSSVPQAVAIRVEAK
ncbi:MAG: Do family serine endopeptidase [Planctomycetaceae bacterium]|nr:Do family serine endopeptidase [Planctomycetaceae bacterium]